MKSSLALSLVPLLALAGGCHDLSAIKAASTAGDGGDAAQSSTDGGDDAQNDKAERDGDVAQDLPAASDAADGLDGADGSTDGPPPSVIGFVRRYETIDPTPFVDHATLRVWNVAIPPAPGSTEVTAPSAVSGPDGWFRLDDVPVGAAAELVVRPQTDRLPNDAGVAAAVRTNVSMRIPATLPLRRDVSLIRFAWVAQVAVECGLYPTIDAALYDMNGFTNGKFVGRSVVFGELQDLNGLPYAGAPITAGDITIDVGHTTPFHNNVNAADNTTSPPRSSVCFLDRNLGTRQYVGSTSPKSTAANRFVMFRVRNSGDTGQGNAVVHVTGFAPASVYLLASGSIGVVTLHVGADPSPPTIPPARTFKTDVYPLLGALGCRGGCHSPPDGPGYKATIVRGLPGLDFTSEEMALSTLQAGMSAACVNDGTPSRLCPAAPDKSLMLTVPLTQTSNQGHPYPVFDNTNDPNYLVIQQWITQLPKP